MKPKGLVVTLCAVNLLAGFGLGVAVDRTVLGWDGQQPADQSPGRIDEEPLAEQPSSDQPTTGEQPSAGERPRREGRWRHEGRRRGGRIAHLQKALDLDDEQVARVREIMEARRPKMREVFAEVRPRLKALEEEAHQELKKVLRPEQVEALETMRKEWEERRARRGRGPSRRWGGEDRGGEGRRGRWGEGPGSRGGADQPQPPQGERAAEEPEAPR